MHHFTLHLGLTFILFGSCFANAQDQEATTIEEILDLMLIHEDRTLRVIDLEEEYAYGMSSFSQAHNRDWFTPEMAYLDDPIPDRSDLPNWRASQAACDTVFAQAWEDMLPNRAVQGYNYQGLKNFLMGYGHQFVSPPAVNAGTMDYLKFYYTIYGRARTMGHIPFVSVYFRRNFNLYADGARTNRGPVWPGETSRIEYEDIDCSISETGRLCLRQLDQVGFDYSPDELIRLNQEAIDAGFTATCHHKEIN